MDFKQYEKDVAELAIYPYANQGVLASVLYPALGLAGEAGEFADKVSSLESHKIDALSFEPEVKEDLIKEAGDVLWYITRMGAELGFDLESLCSEVKNHKESDLKTVTLALMGSTGRVSERIKKALRDDNTDLDHFIEPERRKILGEDLKLVAENFGKVVLVMNSTLEEVSIKNIEKLHSRKVRNTLNGDGDNR